jgi:hypothetical protein
MQILYDLIHSLAKEEKRLYHTYKREGRFQKIYEGYLKAPAYGKPLDQALYQDHFADVSRAFYSMQKRALMDDILLVLMEYSNSRHAGYEFTRLYGRARVLLERRMGNAALAYGEEALQVAQQNDQPGQARLALHVQRNALVLTKSPSLAQYEQLQQLELDLRERQEPELLIESVLHALRLLKQNQDGQDIEAVRRTAQQHHDRLAQVPARLLALDGPLSNLLLEKLQCEEAYYELIGAYDQYHRMLGTLYKTAAKHAPANQHHPGNEVRFYRLTNMLLKSCMTAGDFLQLTGLVYKLSKEVQGLSTEVKEAFLPDYYEQSALHYYYENDLPQALKQILLAINLEDLPTDQVVRCIIYRQAMLLAAHLPKQALEEARHYRQQWTELAEHPLMHLMEVMAYIDMHADIGETLLLIERYKLELKRYKDEKAVMECLNLLSGFLEKKKVRERAVKIFPNGWEPVLRVDLWLRAKQSNKFYYNLMLEDWQQRRKVF